MPKLFSDTMFAYQRSLDFRAMRHNLVTTNITNADTPGFKAKDVNFESMLREALHTEPGLQLARTNRRHIEGGSGVDVLTTDPEVFAINAPMVSFDGNTVSTDREMYKLNANSLLYQSETDILARLFSGLKFAVNDGGAP